MTEWINKFKLVERGIARQAEYSAREHIQGWQDGDKVMVFISPTWCPCVPSEMTPFRTEWKVLLSFSHVTHSQRQRPSLRQAFRSQSEAFSLLPVGGLWLAFIRDLFCNKQESTNKHNAQHRENAFNAPVKIVATTEKQYSVYEHFSESKIAEIDRFSS